MRRLEKKKTSTKKSTNTDAGDEKKKVSERRVCLGIRWHTLRHARLHAANATRMLYLTVLLMLLVSMRQLDKALNQKGPKQTIPLP